MLCIIEVPSLLMYAVESTASAKQDVPMMDICIDVVVRTTFSLSCTEGYLYPVLGI